MADLIALHIVGGVFGILLGAIVIVWWRDDE
jgi:hypothetical protein